MKNFLLSINPISRVRATTLQLLSWAAVFVLLLCLQADSSCAALIKSYDFNGDLTDTLSNGVDLMASGGGISGGRYHFTANQGLRLITALPSTTDYAIEVRFRLEDSTASYNKVIDFQDLAADPGIYVLNGQARFYSLGAAAGTINLNTDYTLGLERSGGRLKSFWTGYRCSTLPTAVMMPCRAGIFSISLKTTFPRHKVSRLQAQLSSFAFTTMLPHSTNPRFFRL